MGSEWSTADTDDVDLDSLLAQRDEEMKEMKMNNFSQNTKKKHKKRSEETHKAKEVKANNLKAQRESNLPLFGLEFEEVVEKEKREENPQTLPSHTHDSDDWTGEEYEGTNVADKVFYRFQKRIMAYPDQVLRFVFFFLYFLRFHTYRDLLSLVMGLDTRHYGYQNKHHARMNRSFPKTKYSI